jgi:hypothetical protein
MRIRPICVFAILTWGFTWGAGNAGAQGFPGYGPNGYPPPGYGAPYGPPPGYGVPNGPPQGYFGPPPIGPMQGMPMPMQGMPMQGMPMQGMPMQGMPMQGMPMPMQGMPMPMQGMPMQGMPMQGMPMQGMPLQGPPMQVMPIPAAPGFPGFAPYPGNPVLTSPTRPSVPAMPTGSAAAGDGGPTGSAAGAPAAQGSTDKGEKIGPPVAPPIPKAGVAPSVVPSEPMISYINGLPPGYLQPMLDGDDHGAPVPQRVSHDHAWFNMDYIMGFNRPSHMPAPLVTTSNGATPPFGGLSSPSTSILFGDKLSYSMQSGFRLNFGSFLDNGGRFSLEGDLMYFIPVGIHYRNQSDTTGVPFIARPFYDVSGSLGPPEPGEHALDVSVPGVLAGGTQITAKSDLYGAEVNTRYHCVFCPGLRADFLLGFRYLHLDESLLIQDNSLALVAVPAGFLGTLVPAGSLISDFDSFGTRNNFYGMQTGARVQWDWDWLYAASYAKLAVGPITQQAIINGGTTLFSGGTIRSTQGALLAQPSNIGDYKRVMIGVVPELGANVGMNITPNLQIFGGYSFLLVNTVLRAGGQIDHTVNATQIPTSATFGAPAGSPSPLFHFAGEVWWMHQLNVGLNWHF